jgi:hypothetical protein
LPTRRALRVYRRMSGSGAIPSLALGAFMNAIQAPGVIV